MESALLTFICTQPLLRLFGHQFLLIWEVKAAVSVTGNHQATLQDFLGCSSTTGCVGSWVRVGDVFVLGKVLPSILSSREEKVFPGCATCWFLARSGDSSVQSVSPLVTGSSPNLAHQGSLKENQNNLPLRVETWRKISLLLRRSRMEGGAALPTCCLTPFPWPWPNKHPRKPEETFQSYRWTSDCPHWHLGNTLNSLQISVVTKEFTNALAFTALSNYLLGWPFYRTP